MALKGSPGPWIPPNDNRLFPGYLELPLEPSALKSNVMDLGKKDDFIPGT